MHQPPGLKHRREFSDSARRDAIAVAIITVASAVVAVTLQPVETFGRWFPAELVLIAIVLIIALAVYAWRRWRELRRAIASGAWLDAELFRQATHDPATQLPNRTLFLDRLEHAVGWGIRRETSVAVLLLDLELIQLGGEVIVGGNQDKLLAAIAKRLLSCVRYVDTVARFDGNRFAILLESIANSNEPELVAERIIDTLGEPVSPSGQNITIVASIGVAVSTPARNRPDDLMRDADVALYYAKRDRNSHYRIFDPTMNVQPLSEPDKDANEGDSAQTSAEGKKPGKSRSDVA